MLSLTVGIEPDKPTKVFDRNTVHFLSYHILLEINHLFFTTKPKNKRT